MAARGRRHAASGGALTSLALRGRQERREMVDRMPHLTNVEPARFFALTYALSWLTYTQMWAREVRSSRAEPYLASGWIEPTN